MVLYDCVCECVCVSDMYLYTHAHTLMCVSVSLRPFIFLGDMYERAQVYVCTRMIIYAIMLR